MSEEYLLDHSNSVSPRLKINQVKNVELVPKNSHSIASAPASHFTRLLCLITSDDLFDFCFVKVFDNIFLFNTSKLSASINIL